MPLPVLYEDEALIAFDQPSGDAGPPRGLAIVQRLDPEASGVLLCAKTKGALDRLSGQFQSKTAERRYLAVAAVLEPSRAMKVGAPIRAPGGGLPEAFTVDFALGEDEERPERMRVFRKHGGRPAATDCRVLEGFGRFALVECQPRGARRHQVRLHLAAAGAPVLNDGLYGDPEVRLLLSDLKRGYKGREEERPLLGRLALHAASIAVDHPLTGERLRIDAPEPADFGVALKYLRKFATARRPGP
ncbi:MAG TPA: pseudouridine synthase [Opitutaceae bacterium]|nr:pseudouridine synthase [Opitutaceae bacterium]